MIEDTERDRLMRRALELAARGPATGPNPRVGCVIVDRTGTVIAEGWHRGAGTPHAEVDALSRLAAGAARGATAVVTLEPCNHTGRTGPCSVALIKAGLARVVYAVADPGPAAAGGADRLRAEGIAVVGGVLDDTVSAFLGDWLLAARLGRPFVTLKWASSLDGRAAAADGSSRWITGPEARRDVHLRRQAADAILVGTGTVLADDPALTARADDGSLLPGQPVPVVIGSRPVPTDAAVRAHPHPPLFFPGPDLGPVLRELHARGIRRAFVEGGPRLASAFVAAGLVDEYLVYLAPTLLGGDRLALGDIGVPGIAGQRRLTVERYERLGDDLLVVARPQAPPPAGPALQPAAQPALNHSAGDQPLSHPADNHADNRADNRAETRN
jgi:diaminohydroxyphosphoribosylaminopyrimidine deaminase / 5-amino-6-(5-phosphoribosylamino)uracil reductase